MPFPENAHPQLLRALAERGYAEPMPVQAAVLAPEVDGRDLLVSAQTGSGKTVAFGLALAPTLLDGADRFGPPGAPLALVIAPTRELALQVQRELAWLYAHTGARVVSCVGGMDIRREQRELARGAHIVVGTPGRLRDHLDRQHLSAAAIRAVVLDEADEMLDLGFREELEAILSALPSERRTLMFSATIPREIARLAREYQRDALRIAAGGEEEAHRDIEYRVALCAPHETEKAVVNLLRWYEARGALVFCQTREAVARLHGNLLERGFAVVALSGELSQAERNRALQSLRDARARVCVATDVAARGIDLPDLGLVIHADLPRDRETLLHRSGRTGRAGRKGISVLVVPFNRRRMAERLLAAARVQASWSGAPSADAIRARDQERLVQEALPAEEALAEEDLAAGRALLARRSPEEIAAALVRLHRARLPAPEELQEALPAPPPRGAPEERRRAPPPRRGEEAGGVWFRMSVGRNANADPRWLLPFLCRRGQVTRQEVGAIRVMDRETRFEIAPHAAARFAAALRRPDSHDEGIRIEPMEPLPRPRHAPAPRPHFARGGPPGRAPARRGGGGYEPRKRRPA
ncbi:DEAD/DEAH box helicase [Caldovatus sediminis]|uniref:DEAD/DEAH box helicase n=1 Tax=Caldovatus sediminis TaxID=2041189 RepID=A0A8J2Z855_9PROT|nr:DEAD/DEAH box helicase [Caldovatus sediminis]GGG19264.1 DEAD/DEAH box helicase [Caldovatus sediminis]